jgi:hypothetical protein
VETKGWRTVEGKATQRKRKNETVDKTCMMEIDGKPLMMQNGGWGKKSHQLMKTNATSTKKTWADVIRTSGINVQIVLGNGNLRLTTPMKKRGERQGGEAWRLVKTGVDRERGAMGRGKEGWEKIISGGNKGRQMGKNGRGRMEEREEPGAVASVQAGHLDQKMHSWLWARRHRGFRPHNWRPVLGQSPWGARRNVWFLSFNSVQFTITLRLQALMRK